MTADAGWYQDPWNASALRWWDGASWTAHHRLPEPGPRATFPAAAVWPAVVGIAATVVFARVTSTLLLNALNAPTELFIVYFYATVFGGLWCTCLVVSRTHGSGRPFADFGLSWKRSDIWPGLAVLGIARVAQGVALLPWAGQVARLRHVTEGLQRVPITSFLLFAIAAVFVAPVLEELVFRGMLQRSLAAKWGHGWAIAVQGALFGMYHVTPGLGSTNIPYAVSLAAAGWVLGWAVWHWRRVGVSSTGHFFVNVIGVIALYAAR